MDDEYGMKVLHECAGDDPAVDIVFVHGLRGNRIRTWQNGDVVWPRDLLPPDVDKARIMTWGYDSDVARLKNFSSQNSIFGHAENFLDDVARERRNIANPGRPLIFVGHSLGGLLIKEALNRAHQLSTVGGSLSDARKGNIFSSTHGVVFLGVPHRGSSKAQIGSLVAAIAEAAFLRPNKALLDTLSETSPILEHQRNSFSKVSRDMELACFCEEIPISGLALAKEGLVVPKESANIDGPNVTNGSIPRDHHQMCKFSNRGDIGYQRVSGKILDMCDSITEKEKARHRTLGNEILAQLEFEGMNRRYEDIDEAYQRTFEWVYQDQSTGFPDWLGGNNGIFWITGKPGSGKSTLMKFLLNDKRTPELLQRMGSDTLLAGFFFHDHAGSPLLKKHEGLLRAILHQILSNHRSLAAVAFPQRWAKLQSDSVTARQKMQGSTVSITELRAAMTALMNQQGHIMRLCLLIDGLDEFEGEHEETLRLLTGFVTIAKERNHAVKICVSSRPIAIFDLSFSGQPQLAIHDLTAGDIRTYVRTSLESVYSWTDQLSVNPEDLDLIVGQVQEKSAGVFLWVKLVTQKLKEGARKQESRNELLTRLKAMPADLSALFEHILGSIDHLHRAEAAKVLSMVHQESLITPITISYALEPEPSGLDASLDSYDPHDLSRRSIDMTRRIEARLGGLVETESLLSGEILGFLHVTFREYLNLPDSISWLEESAGGCCFDPHEALAKSYLLQIRHLKFEETQTFPGCYSLEGEYSTLVGNFMKHAARATFKASPSVTRYLNAFETICSRRYSAFRKEHDSNVMKKDELTWESRSGKTQTWIGYLMYASRGNRGWYGEPCEWESDFESWAARMNMKRFLETRGRRGYKPILKPGRPLLNYAVDPQGVETGRPTLNVSDGGSNLETIQYLLELGCGPNSSPKDMTCVSHEEKTGVWPPRNEQWTAWQACIYLCWHDLIQYRFDDLPMALQLELIKNHVAILTTFIRYGACTSSTVYIPTNRAPCASVNWIADELSKYHLQELDELKILIQSSTASKSESNATRDSTRKPKGKIRWKWKSSKEK